MTNKIGWCSMTFNPVIGCKNNCSYCYAKKINDRFKFIENWNIPEWREKSFNKKFPKNPQRIFVGSMSEIAHWEAEWMNKVIFKIFEYPQHTFQLLTKHSEVYIDYDFPENCWLGITATTNLALYETDFITNITNKKRIKFICFEPILNSIDPKYIPKNVNWIILGAETGNRKDKVIPNLDWVLEIVRYCEHYKIPVYIKDNLVKYYADCRGYKQFPVIK